MSLDLFLRTAQASGDHWGTTVKAALTALGPLPDDVNFGLVCVTVPLTEHLPSIMTFLRETTPIRGWAIAVGAGLAGPVGTVRDRPAIALLVARLPSVAYRLVESWKEPRRSQFLAHNKAWLSGQDMPVGLMQGDAFDPDLAEMLADLSAQAHAFLVGGVGPGQPGGLSGVLLGSPLTLATGLTQGCQILPGRFRVSEVTDEIIMQLDGKPALDALKSAVGETIAQDLHKAAGVIHLGLPVPGSDRTDYLVRSLIGIDPERGWLAVGSRLSVGDPVIFVQRDNESARKDMRRMLADIAGRVAGRGVLGGIYVSCVARGSAMFGTDEAEIDLITKALGTFPLIGIISQGEFCHDRLYGYTGVLALILS
jgi:hypothetical protein